VEQGLSVDSLPFERPRLETAEGSRPLQEAWDGLAERSGNVFGSSEWARAWWRHWGTGYPLEVAACRGQDGDLVAVLPLYLATRRPLRILRFIGHGPGDLLGPVHLRDHRLAVGAVLREHLRTTSSDWDLLLAQQLPVADGWSQALSGHVLRRERSPLLTLQWSTWDEYLATRSANFRQQVRRKGRRLTRSHSVRFRLTSSPDQLDRDLSCLFALHAARWGAAASIAFAPPRQAFHRDFARRALCRGWLRLWVMEIDDVAVAAWYGFRIGGVESYYQSGRDPRWERESVGLILLAHTVRCALEDGMREYRFLRGGEAYKDRFTDDESETESFVLGSGLRGSLAVAAARRSAGRSWSHGPLASVRRAVGLQG
jgi:CelD/BcsL family acetyltransferase involved in cellulose biosynthesis